MCPGEQLHPPGSANCYRKKCYWLDGAPGQLQVKVIPEGVDGLAHWWPSVASPLSPEAERQSQIKLGEVAMKLVLTFYQLKIQKKDKLPNGISREKTALPDSNHTDPWLYSSSCSLHPSTKCPSPRGMKNTSIIWYQLSMSLTTTTIMLR